MGHTVFRMLFSDTVVRVLRLLTLIIFNVYSGVVIYFIFFLSGGGGASGVAHKETSDGRRALEAVISNKKWTNKSFPARMK